ncbi:N-terminal acetyltransferase A, auxiliary subunit, partial [Mycena vulgaris]
ARFLDGQDRFLNTESVKYRLRAGWWTMRARCNLFGIFSKVGLTRPCDEVQSRFCLVEEATPTGPALKTYMAANEVCKHRVFAEVVDAQYDFHGYSLRKFTINVYLTFV